MVAVETFKGENLAQLIPPPERKSLADAGEGGSVRCSIS